MPRTLPTTDAAGSSRASSASSDATRQQAALDGSTYVAEAPFWLEKSDEDAYLQALETARHAGSSPAGIADQERRIARTDVASPPEPVRACTHTVVAITPTPKSHIARKDAAQPSALVRACAATVREALGKGLLIVLACEPSLEGVLLATGIAYLAHADDGVLRLARADEVQLQIGELLVEVPHVQTDEDVAFARRVLQGFARRITQGCRKLKADGTCPTRCSHDCVRRVKLACASDSRHMPDIVYRYLRLGFACGPRVRGLIAHPQVAAFDALARSVLGECEHTRQFVRFSHMADGSYLASFRPKDNTLPLVAGYFVARMGTERFCLVDPLHHIAAFHEAGERRCTIVRLDDGLVRLISEGRSLAADEPIVRAMWQRFYQRTATPGRDASQRGYDLRTKWMPQRFWSGLTELAPQQQGEAVRDDATSGMCLEAHRSRERRPAHGTPHREG